MNTCFDDIRHYTDSEMREAMTRIVKYDELKSIVSYAFPDCEFEDFVKHLLAIESTAQLQHEIMVEGMKVVIEKTMTSFSFSGLENIDPHKAYLYISNHRDIVLDAYLLQCILDTHGMSTTRITFGSNLMKNEFLRELGLCNKMFRTERAGTAKQFYASMLHLSDYINHSILQDNESIWIAQRGGRTKDGYDLTDPALIKMLGMQSPHRDIVQGYNALNIVPLSISYEWEPCDCLKAIELCKSENGEYVKSKNEDLNSIVTGIVQPKGMVHLTIGTPVSLDEISNFPTNRNDFCIAMAALLDSRINGGYHLSPNNFIAYDMMNGSRKYAEKYTPSQYETFSRRLDEVLAENPNLDTQKLRRYFLEIYACAVRN